MLDLIRRHATGWIIWVLLLLVGIPFAFFGVYDYVGSTGSTAVARVNGAEIGYRDFQLAYQRQRQQLQEMLGADLGAAGIDDARLRERTLDALVDEEVLIQAGVANGMRVGDRQLAIAIQSFPVFQQDGGFSQERYENWLRVQGESPGGFEFGLRRSLLSEQIRAGLIASSFATTPETERVLRLQRQQRTFSRLRIPIEPYAANVEIVRDRAREFYEANRDRFVSPERVRLRYVVLSRERIADEIGASEEELRALFEARRANYRTPEQRRASHILIRVPADADESALGEARERLEDLRRRIVEGGASFEEVAREHSEDPGSAKNGGDLGYFGRGVMDPAFEEAAFALSEGEVSDPVRSGFGLHLIRVEDVREARTRTFEEAREEVLREFQREQADRIYFDQAERLANLAFEHPESLAIAAEELELAVRESGPIARDGTGATGVLDDPEVIEAAFGRDVLEARNNSRVLEISAGRAVVVRVAEHLPEAPRSFDEVRGEIVAALKTREARDRVAAAGEDALERLRSGVAPESIEESLGAAWTEPRTVVRDAASADARLIETLFSMPRPRGDRAMYEGFSVDGGDFVILALHEVETAQPSGEEAAQARSSARSSIAADHGRAEFDAFVRALREQADVTLNRENVL